MGIAPLTPPEPYMQMLRLIDLDQRVKQRMADASFYVCAGMLVTAASVRYHASCYEAEIQRRLREVRL